MKFSKSHLLPFLEMTLLSTFFLGCSSLKSPESIEQKMARFSPKEYHSNELPPLKFSSPQEGTRQRARKEIREGRSTSQSQAKTQGKQLSPKRLYFMSLYEQYRGLSQFLKSKKTPLLKHCPQFHTTLLENKNFQTPLPKTPLSFLKNNKALTRERISLFPELSLPMTPRGQHPTLGEYLLKNPKADGDESFQKALTIHLSKTFSELKELCNWGYSSHFYRYENLTTHLSRNKYKYEPGEKSLNTLVKTTLFSNMVIRQRLSELYTHGQQGKKVLGRGPASERRAQRELASPLENFPYENQVMKKLGLQWTKEYLKNYTSYLP